MIARDTTVREGKRAARRLGLVVLIGAALIGGAIVLRSQAPRTVVPPALASVAVTAPASPNDELALLEYRAMVAPKNAGVALALGQEYAELNRLPEALAQFQRASRVAPGLLPARVGQGQVWLRLQRPGRAVEHFEWAVRRLPEHAELRLELGAAYLSLRDANSGLRHLREAVKLTPESPEAYRALASGYLAIFSYERATEAAQRAVELEPEVVENWSVLGSVHLNNDRFPEAEQALRRALQLKPEDPTANVLLARTLAGADPTPASDREIQALLARALTTDPFHAEALQLLGRHYLEQDQLDLAAATLRRARERYPEVPQVTLLLGQALVRRGDAEEGRRLIAAAQAQIDQTVDFRGLEFQAARNPNPNVQMRLARMYMQQRYYDSAVHLLRKALRQTPDDPALKQTYQEALAGATQGESGVKP
ncbi:MAG: tetratricopeptide repeat protein [Armatimonadota bacterium]